MHNCEASYAINRLLVKFVIASLLVIQLTLVFMLYASSLLGVLILFEDWMNGML